MSDSQIFSYTRGDKVEALDESGKVIGQYSISRVMNPKTVKVVDENGIIKSFSPARLRLIKKSR